MIKFFIIFVSIEEELIKKIDEDYEKIKKLAEVLDNNSLNGKLLF